MFNSASTCLQTLVGVRTSSLVDSNMAVTRTFANKNACYRCGYKRGGREQLPQGRRKRSDQKQGQNQITTQPIILKTRSPGTHSRSSSAATDNTPVALP